MSLGYLEPEWKFLFVCERMKEGEICNKFRVFDIVMELQVCVVEPTSSEFGV